MILALQSVSASFNPIITLTQVASGQASRSSGLLLIAGQLVGGLLGCVTANLMFGLDAVSRSAHRRTGAGQLLGEVVATAGLVVVVLGCERSGRADRIAYAVGAYIAAAYWFTSSTSFANPAVTVARMFSDTFSGIAASSAAPFVLAQLVGGAGGWLVVRALYPLTRPVAPDARLPTVT